ncbi:MAG TPA: phosphotransferase [Candidatus Dormibacteraeota bacterium]
MDGELEHEAVFDRIPGWAGRPRSAHPLSGGITNRNYRVALGAEIFVVRIPAKGAGWHGIDRRNEYEASLLAASCGVGPEVVTFLEREGVLVTRFIHGRPVSDADVHLPGTLGRVAKALLAIHHAGVLADAFSPFRVVERYATVAREHRVAIPEEFEQAAAIAKTIEQALPISAPLLCHNDLLNANFIDDGDRIRIVDWEYAGMGDPYFDLGNFAVNHGLAEEEQNFLLEAYAGEALEPQRARLQLMRVMSDFREAMWAVVQQVASELDFDFRGYSRRHFERLLAAAGDSRFRTWLEAAAA